MVYGLLRVVDAAKDPQTRRKLATSKVAPSIASSPTGVHGQIATRTALSLAVTLCSRQR